MVFAADTAESQRVLGIGDDATMLPSGALRVQLSTSWSRFNDRFGMNSAGRSDGSVEPLGQDFDMLALGARDVEALAPIEQAVRGLAGVPELDVSLGRVRVSLDATTVTTPIILELGVTSRLSLSLNVPYVRTQTNVVVDPEKTAASGNMGANPALSSTATIAALARSRNTQVVTEIQGASAQLQARLDACQADPAGPGCSALNANRPAALALIATSGDFVGGIEQLYGTTTSGGAAFVPLDQTATQLAIEARIQTLNASFMTLLAASGDVITSTPFPAQTRLTLPEAQSLFLDESFGVGAAPLETVERSHIGDIELGAKLLLFDGVGRGTAARLAPSGFRARSAVRGIFRAGTGQSDSPDDFVDIATGDGQHDVEVRSITDLLFGRRFWTSLIAGYGVQLADRQYVRITESPDRPFAALYRRQKVDRDLGDYYEVEAIPRYVFNDYLALSAHYFYRHKSSDAYRGTFAATDLGGSDVTLDASTLDLETARTEHRVGGGISYSTLAAFAHGRAGLPIELALSHYQTLKGSGNQPKAFITELRFRFYRQLFGRGEPRPTGPTR